MNIVNELSDIQKMFEALLGVGTVLGFKVENNTELCLQGARRQVGEIDQHMGNGKTKCGTVSTG